MLLPQAQPQISPKIIVDEIRPLLQEQKHSIMGDGGLLNRLATKMRKKVKSTLGIGPNARNGFLCHLFLHEWILGISPFSNKLYNVKSRRNVI